MRLSVTIVGKHYEVEEVVLCPMQVPSMSLL